MLTKVFNFLRSFSLWVWVVMAVVGLLLASNWERITPFPADAPKPFHEQMLVESKLWTNSTEPLGHFITARKAGSLVEVGVAPDALFYTLKDGKRYATSAQRLYRRIQHAVRAKCQAAFDHKCEYCRTRPGIDESIGTND